MLAREPGEKLPRFSGEPRVLAEALNDISEAIEQTGKAIPAIIGGKGVRVRAAKGSVIIEAVTQDTGGGAFDFPFRTSLSVADDVTSAAVVPGTMDGVLSAAFTPAPVVAGGVVYAFATYATAYDERPTSVTIAVAESAAAVPKSHDTRWVIAIANIEAVPDTTPPQLRAVQLVIGGQTSRRTRPRKSFDATRVAGQLTISAGHLTALTNPSDGFTLNQAVPGVSLPLQVGTVVFAVSVAAGAPDGESAYTIGAPSFEYRTLDNTNQGLFVNIPAVPIYAAEIGTTIVAPTAVAYATGTLSPSTPPPSTIFRFAICDVVAGGADEWIITQRTCGDIAIPLAINWGIPFTPEA